jgi:predicted permease
VNVLAMLRYWWRIIATRARVDREVAEEFQFHLDAYAADLVSQGLSPVEAARKARIDLGRKDTQNEKYRDAIGLRVFDELATDTRYGLRSLLKGSGYSIVAVLSLALGIGATTAMFSLIYAVLIHPFPYANADRIMNPGIVTIEGPHQQWFATWKSQFETLGKAKSIESLLGFRNGNAELTGGDLPEDVDVMYLTENADSFLGVPALLGRGIQPSDAKGGGQQVVVLNYRFWQRHFQGDEAVIGRTLQIDSQNYTIVGVMPRSFAFNNTTGVSDVYLPGSLQHDTANPPIHAFYVPWIKVKANVSLATADAELDAIVHRFAKENPDHFTKKFRVQLEPIIVPYQQSTGHTLALLLTGVLLLLAVGCANCSILLLARGKARQHELAIRSAIGASRWRLVRQLLVEALVISFSGAVLGLAASYWLAKLPLQLSPNSFPPESVVRINVPILAFSVGLAFLCGIAFGLLPALRLSRPDLARSMQGRLLRLSPGTGKHRLNLLITGQIALTFLLLATAGAAIGAFLGLMKLPLGYDPQNVMQAGIMLHWRDARDWQKVQPREGRIAYIEQIRQKIAAVPGVTSVAVATESTPPYSGVDFPVEVAAGPSKADQEARVHFVGPEFFATLHMQLLQGRIWTSDENMRGDFVAIVNESFARQYWTHQDPLAQQVRLPALKVPGPVTISSTASDGWRQVLGVIADVRNDGVDKPAVPEVYVPYTTHMYPFAQFEIRTEGEPLAYLHAVRAAVQSVASDQQVSNGVYDLEEALRKDAQWSRQRVFSVLFGFFSTLALLLAAVGLFSVVSYGVAEKTGEFGVRLALGASRSNILWVAASVALRSALMGIAAGLAIDMVIQKLLARWMNHADVSPHSLMLATLLLAACSVVACLLPARRAASIHPVEALRYE